MCCFCLCQAMKDSTAYIIIAAVYVHIYTPEYCFVWLLILFLRLFLYHVFFSLHFHLEGSQRISDSEISDYDCEDGVGVITGNVLGEKTLRRLHILSLH